MGKLREQDVKMCTFENALYFGVQEHDNNYCAWNVVCLTALEPSIFALKKVLLVKNLFIIST